jgi:dienelactone hydrolase
MWTLTFIALSPALLDAGDEPPPALPRYPDRSRLLVVRDAQGGEREVKTAEDWAVRRRHILLGMEEVMGSLERAPGEAEALRRLPLDLRVESEEEAGGFVRRKISFAAEPDDRASAYLLIPRPLAGKAAAMLCLHQTTAAAKAEPAGLAGKPSLHYAAHLAARGYVTLAPDYPNFGEHAFDTYGRGYRSGTMKAIRDNRRAVDLLASLPEVDPERIGCIGHSLGGHNAIFTAVFEPRLRVVVSSCGFNAFGHYYGGDLTGWSSATYMPRIKTYGGWKEMPFDFHEVVGALAPRPFFTSSPLGDSNFAVAGVREVIASARPVYALLGADERLEAYYPDCGHEFPEEAREKAYAFIDRWLMARGAGAKE